MRGKRGCLPMLEPKSRAIVIARFLGTIGSMGSCASVRYLTCARSTRDGHIIAQIIKALGGS